MIAQPDGLEEAIRLRWTSVSEQKLEFITIGLDDFDASKPPQVDLLFAPAILLGSMVEGGWVSDLPEEVAARVGNKGQTDSNNKVDYPSHWMDMVRYGKKTYALPLGCTLQLIGIEKPANESTPSDTSATDHRFHMVDWSNSRVTPKQSTVFTDPDIVDHFLTIAATKRPNAYEGSLFFKLVDCSSRVSEPWMVEAATLLRALCSGKADDTRRLLYLGWPDNTTPENLQWSIPVYRQTMDAQEEAVAEANQQASQIRAVIDGSKGSGVFLSSRTRQSSKATFFLKWISEATQIAAFSKLWSWSFPESTVDDPNNSTYASVSYRAAMADDIASTFQIKNGMVYRAEFKKALEQIVVDPNVDILQTLERCRQDLNLLTEKFGRDQQQDSLERTLGLRE